jgi:hypothetical protein
MEGGGGAVQPALLVDVDGCRVVKQELFSLAILAAATGDV